MKSRVCFSLPRSFGQPDLKCLASPVEFEFLELQADLWFRHLAFGLDVEPTIIYIYICRSQKGNSVNFEIDQSKRELTERPVKKEISVLSKTVNFEID